MNRFLFVIYVFSIFSCGESINTADLAGVYINTNYNYTPFFPEIPYGADTLRLSIDGSFYSRYWGAGTYSVESSVLGSRINLVYNYEFGLAGATFNLKKKKGAVRIILDDERGHYYRKVK